MRLNRRLAPDVYLGTVALTIGARGQIRLAGDGAPIEWLVKMRRLPAERMLDTLIQHAIVTASDIDAIARVLSAFFQRCPVEPLSADGYRARLAQAIDADCRALRQPAYGLDRAIIDRLRAAQQALLARRPALFAARAERGKIIEGHGDLRPEHVCLAPTGPVIFDCLEFNRQFRLVDPADELAFLSLECERLGAGFIEPILFQRYAAYRGDRPPRALIDFYKTCRACLRAKLAVWHLHDLDRADHRRWLDRARDYLRLADRYRWRG